MQGALAEVRGDWKAFKEIFRFPGWRGKDGCCWKCNCIVSQVTGATLDAPRRRPENRLTHWSFLSRQRALKRSTSALQQAPYLRTSCFQIDWLHACDKGVAAEFLGKFLRWAVLPKLEGGGGWKAACKPLLLKITQWYLDHGVTDKLQNLTWGMVQKAGSEPAKN